MIFENTPTIIRIWKIKYGFQVGPLQKQKKKLKNGFQTKNSRSNKTRMCLTHGFLQLYGHFLLWAGPKMSGKLILMMLN